MLSTRLTLTCLALLLPSLAGAHITLETRQAEAGGDYKAVFRIGHDCDGSPIKEIIVHIPDGVTGVRPMPKAGWQIETVRAPLSKPYVSHGRTLTEGVTTVRWHGGRLPGDWYDEFVLAARLPDQPGRIYWPVSQVCEQGRIDWQDTSAESRTPAAVLDLLPRTEPAHHH